MPVGGDEVRLLAAWWEEYSGRIGDLAAEIEAGERLQWSSDAATAFRARLREAAVATRGLCESLEGAAELLRRHARHVDEAAALLAGAE